MGFMNFTWKNKNRDIDVKQYAYYIGSYHYNWHEDVELLIVLQGEIEVNNNGQNYSLEKDDVMMINSNIGHATLAKKTDSIAMVLHLNPIYFSSYYKDYQLLDFHCISNSMSKNEEPFKKIRTLAIEMIQKIGGETPSEKLYFESLLHQIAATLVQFFPPKVLSTSEVASHKKKSSAVNKMIRYIDHHYKEKLSLEALSKISGYHRSYISQIFKQQIGINYYEYLTRIRLREATYALINLDEKISDIALSYGFSDVKAFNKAFKSSFGKTPSEYRRQLPIEKMPPNRLREKRYLTEEEFIPFVLRYGDLKDMESSGQVMLHPVQKEGLTDEDRQELRYIKELLDASLTQIIHLEKKYKS